MSDEIPLFAIEQGSTTAFIRLGLELSGESASAGEAYFNALMAHLNGREAIETRAYFSTTENRMIYLPLLQGAPLFAALFAFAKALRCKTYSDTARANLKAWVNGDERAVGYTMVLLKWGVDSTLPGRAIEQPTEPTREDSKSDMLALSRIVEALREGAGERYETALALLKKVAVVDGKRLESVLPPIVDALAGPDRDRVLQVLATGVKNGLNPLRFLPVLSGLLLDRDYFERETVMALFDCLNEVAKAGYDISLTWTFAPLAFQFDSLPLDFVATGVARGYPVLPFVPHLLDYLRLSIPPGNDTSPEQFSNQIGLSGEALDILAMGVGRGELDASILDGERDD